MESKTDRRLKIAWMNPPADRMFYEYNLAWMYIKTHVDLYSSHKDKIDWIKPIYDWHDIQTIPEAVERFKDADVILFSNYIWNYSVNLEAAKYVKEKYPHILTVMGGPQSEWLNPDFVKKYWMYDYHCEPVSPAEIYTLDWIDSWFEDGKPLHHKIAFDKRSLVSKTFEYPEVSIYEHNKDYIVEAKKYFDSIGATPRIAWESTRGCPFRCTFCEWGGGTGGKMKKKPMEIIVRDLDCLKELGFKEIDVIDSNAGAFKERDWEIFRLLKERNMRIMVISMLKTKDLKRKKEITDKLMENGFSANLSVQTFSKVALTNAQRPDLDLEQQFELVEYIRNKLIQEHGENFFDKPAEEIAEIASVEFIMGMPGSTKEDFYNEYEMMEMLGSWVDGRFDYNYLPNTIASTEQDLDKFKVVLSPVYTKSIFNTKNHFHTISNCYSYSKEDMHEMFFMNCAGNYLRKNVYDMFKDTVDIVQFMKDCYVILSDMDDFDFINNQIKRYFDPNEPSDFFNFVDFDGELRYKTEVISNFAERNNKMLMAALMTKYYVNMDKVLA
jgi:hypothetical protein